MSWPIGSGSTAGSETGRANARALPWIAFLLLSALDCRAQSDPGEVVVSAGSKAVRAVYEQPVTSDTFALLVARETFRIAEDQKAANALDEYLGRVGLLALAGEPFKPSGTIGRIVKD